jgi:hypothetical protein
MTVIGYGIKYKSESLKDALEHYRLETLYASEKEVKKDLKRMLSGYSLKERKKLKPQIFKITIEVEGK